jgi:hypothetical protein
VVTCEVRLVRCLYVGRLCFPIGYVGLRTTFVHGKDEGWEVVEFKLYYSVGCYALTYSRFSVCP